MNVTSLGSPNDPHSIAGRVRLRKVIEAEVTSFVGLLAMRLSDEFLLTTATDAAPICAGWLTDVLQDWLENEYGLLIRKPGAE